MNKETLCNQSCFFECLQIDVKTDLEKRPMAYHSINSFENILIILYTVLSNMCYFNCDLNYVWNALTTFIAPRLILLANSQSLYLGPRLGPDSIKRCHLTSIGNPIVEIRRSYDRLISTMGFPILVRWHLYIESGPWSLPLITVTLLPAQLTESCP